MPVTVQVRIPQELERVIELRLGARPSDPPSKHLFVEIMGRYSNVFLTNADMGVLACAYQVGLIFLLKSSENALHSLLKKYCKARRVSCMIYHGILSQSDCIFVSCTLMQLFPFLCSRTIRPLKFPSSDYQCLLSSLREFKGNLQSLK